MNPWSYPPLTPTLELKATTHPQLLAPLPFNFNFSSFSEIRFPEGVAEFFFLID